MKYSLVIQHTTTKQFYVYLLKDLGYSEYIYYKFNITLGKIPEGEYQYILFANNDEYEVVVNCNNIFKTDVNNEKILVTYENMLTNNTKILVAGKQEPILSTGLIRVGEYDNNSYQYNVQTKYKSYEG